MARKGASCVRRAELSREGVARAGSLGTGKETVGGAAGAPGASPTSPFCLLNGDISPVISCTLWSSLPGSPEDRGLGSRGAAGAWTVGLESPPRPLLAGGRAVVGLFPKSTESVKWGAR